MKKVAEETRWYFVDESGDPVFYDAKGQLILGKEGISPILIIGFIRITHPEIIHSQL